MPPSLSPNVYLLPTGVPAPCLYEKPKTSKRPLTLPELNLFMRNQPRSLPSKPSHSRDARVTRDIRIRPEIRREGAEVLKTPRTRVGRGYALERVGAAPFWGLQGIRAGQRDQPMPVGTAVFVRVDGGKDMHHSLHGNSDHSRL